MNEQHIHARLGWLEQAIVQLAEDSSSAFPKRAVEQYVARYFEDFNTVSLGIFWEYVLPDMKQDPNKKKR